MFEKRKKGDVSLNATTGATLSASAYSFLGSSILMMICKVKPSIERDEDGGDARLAAG